MGCPEPQMSKRRATHFTSDLQGRSQAGTSAGPQLQAEGSFRKWQKVRWSWSLSTAKMKCQQWNHCLGLWSVPTSSGLCHSFIPTGSPHPWLCGSTIPGFVAVTWMYFSSPKLQWETLDFVIQGVAGCGLWDRTCEQLFHQGPGRILFYCVPMTTISRMPHVQAIRMLVPGVSGQEVSGDFVCLFNFQESKCSLSC